MKGMSSSSSAAHPSVSTQAGLSRMKVPSKRATQSMSREWRQMLSSSWVRCATAASSVSFNRRRPSSAALRAPMSSMHTTPPAMPPAASRIGAAVSCTQASASSPRRYRNSSPADVSPRVMARTSG